VSRHTSWIRRAKINLHHAASRAIFIGYSETSKAYRVWIPSEKKVRVTRDVKFLNGSHINDDSPELTAIQEVEIGNSNNPNQKDSCSAVLQDESRDENCNRLHDEVEEQDERESENLPAVSATGSGSQIQRGPGRPRKVLTGKPGRPKKEYNMVPAMSIFTNLEHKMIPARRKLTNGKTRNSR